jgi:4-amino-4-deoxy-L-arabinose transferase-like glycosyltransferase
MSRLLLRPWIALLVLALMAAAIAFPGAGAERPLDAHEAYVARTATEMRRRGDWVLPYFNGEPRLQKPPLSYWLAMGVHAAAGGDAQSTVTEREARTPSMLAGIGLVLATCLLAWIVFEDYASGLFAGAICATSNAFVVWTHSAQPEMLYAFCCAIEVLGFVLAVRSRERGGRALAYSALGWLGFALAVLSKGPLLPSFLLVGTAIALARHGGRKTVLPVLRPLLGIAIVAAVCAPWIVAVLSREQHALEYWRAQMFDRTGGAAAAGWRPLERCAKLALPWSLLLIPAVAVPWRARRTADPARMLLWFGFAVSIAALSFSVEGKGYYLLPAMPCAFALMAGESLALARRWSDDAQRLRYVGTALRTHAGLGILGACAAIAVALVRWNEDAPSSQPWLASILFACALVPAALALRASGARPAESLRSSIASFALLFVGLAVYGVDVTSRRALDGEFARAAGEHLAPQRKLLVIDGNPQLLVYYADHAVDRIPPVELAEELREYPDALLVDSEWRVANSGLEGRVLLRQAGDDEQRARVLFDPHPDAPASRGTPTR